MTATAQMRGPAKSIIKPRLVAGANGAGQAGVVGSVVFVPQGLAAADAIGEDFQLLARAGRGLRGLVGFIVLGGEILIVTVLEDRLENVFECRIGNGGNNSSYR